MSAIDDNSGKSLDPVPGKTENGLPIPEHPVRRPVRWVESPSLDAGSENAGGSVLPEVDVRSEKRKSSRRKKTPPTPSLEIANTKPAGNGFSSPSSAALPGQSPGSVRQFPRIGLGLSLFLIGSAAVALALFGVLWFLETREVGVRPTIARLGPPKTPAGGTGTNSSEPEKSIPGRLSTSASSPQGVPEPMGTPPATGPTEPAAGTGKLRYHRESQMLDAWRSVRQAVLVLEVTRRGHRRTVPATIVDSRGWAITSFSALAGAENVVARFAPAAPDDPGTVRDQSAAITGYVAAWPEADLILLEVDRRMIEIIGPLPMMARAPVAGSYLLGFGPVPSGWKQWGIETQVTTSADLMANTPDSLVWTEHDQPSDAAAPGMPLFSIGGELAAMNTVRRENGRQFAVPVELILVWLENIRSRPAEDSGSRLLVSLDPKRAIVQLPDPVVAAPVAGPQPGESVRGTGTSDPVPGAASSAANPAAPAPSGVDLAELQRRLEDLADDCDGFGFVPTNAAEYQRLIRLTMALNEARLLLAIPEDAPGTLSRGQWRGLDRITVAVSDRVVEKVSESGRAHLERANQIALDEAAKMSAEGDQSQSAPRDAVVFVITEIDARTSPQIDGQPSTLFELDVQLGGLICAIDPELHVFRQQTRWMLFGRWSREAPLSIRTTGGETVSARRFELLLPAGPLK